MDHSLAGLSSPATGQLTRDQQTYPNVRQRFGFVQGADIARGHFATPSELSAGCSKS
jgi:hypothetical protein